MLGDQEWPSSTVDLLPYEVRALHGGESSSLSLGEVVQVWLTIATGGGLEGRGG